MEKVEEHKTEIKTSEKLATNSQDNKTTIEKVVSLSDKLLTPEKDASDLNEKTIEPHTNGQNGRMSLDNVMQIDEKLDACLNGDGAVKRKSTEVDLDLADEPLKKQLKTSEDTVVTKESNGIQNSTPSLVN